MERNTYKKSQQISSIHYFGRMIIIKHLFGEYHYDSIKKEIFELTDGSNTVGDIAKKMMEKYQINKQYYDDIVSNVNEFCSNSDVFIRSNEKVEFNCRVTGEEGKYFPERLQIELTDMCNLYCRHCYKSASNKNCNMLSEDIYYKLLKYITNNIKTIAFTGGEPLLHPDFERYVIDASKQCERLELNTNGTLIYKASVDIINLFDEISITLYGIDEKTYNTFCGVEVAFNMLNKSCKYLRENGIEFTINVIIDENNFNGLEQYVYIAKEMGAHRIRIGTISKIGRAVENKELNGIRTIEFERMQYRKIRELEKKYGKEIHFDLWDREVYRKHEKKKPIYINKCLSCNAGNLNWAMNEKGIFKPCVMLPEENTMTWTFEEWKAYVEGRDEINWEAFLMKFTDWCKKKDINIKEYCEFIDVI